MVVLLVFSNIKCAVFTLLEKDIKVQQVVDAIKKGCQPRDFVLLGKQKDNPDGRKIPDVRSCISDPALFLCHGSSPHLKKIR